MNSTNYTIGGGNTNDIAEYITKARDLLIDYGVRGISAAGVLFNLLTIIVLHKKNIFKHSFYEFLRCRCICNLLVCLVGIYFQRPDKFCENCVANYIEICINWFAVIIPGRIAFLAAIISDILIISNRLSTISSNDQNKGFFNKLTKKVNLLICFSIPTILVAPVPFALRLSKVSDLPTETMGYWSQNEFGDTMFFRIYLPFLAVFEAIIPLIVLIVLNTMTASRFKKVMSTKKQVHRNSSTTVKRVNKANAKFTSMIISLMLVCIVTRLLDSVTDVYLRLKVTWLVSLEIETDAIVQLVRYFALFLLQAAHALDGLLYFWFDANFKHRLLLKSVRNLPKAGLEEVRANRS
jgi:hypothetical protein